MEKRMKNKSSQKDLQKFIIKNLKELNEIHKNIYNIYIICGIKKKEDENVLMFYRDKIEQMKSSDYQELKQILEEIICKKSIGVIMLERNLKKENYEKLFKIVYQSLENINENVNHKFYKERKIQIEVIKNVIILLNVILSKFKDYLGLVNNGRFIVFLNDIQQCMGIAQKIKLQTDYQNMKNQNFILKFNFHNPYEQKFQQLNKYEVANENEDKNVNISTANQTTRVSSVYKSSVSNSRMRRLNYTPSLRSSFNWKVVQSQLKKYFTDNKLSGSNSEGLRCHTARLARKTHKDESQEMKNGYLNNSNKNKIRDSRLHSSVSSGSDKNGYDMNKNGQDYVNQKSISRHLSRQSYRSTISSQSEANLKKNVPRMAVRINANCEVMKTIHEFADELSKQNEKNQKISQNIGNLENLNQIQKRKFKSQIINFDIGNSKMIRKFKNNTYKKKSFMRNKNEFEIEQQNMKQKNLVLNENDKKQSSILLIKLPIQKNVNRKSNLQTNEIQQISPFHITLKQQRKGKIIKEGKDENENNFVFIDSTNIDKKKEQIDYLSDDLFKIDIEEKNKIRAQFFHSRIGSDLIGSGNQENSIFFIEQEFLGHRENLRYQKYLKQMKEINGVEPRNPFNLETETIELHNEKLIEIQRFQTFKSENQWIRQHYFVNNEAEIDQNGMCLKIQNCLES